MRCAIWYHLYNLKNENTHGGVLLLVMLQAKAAEAPPWVLFKFFKLYKWHQIAQRITCISSKTRSDRLQYFEKICCKILPEEKNINIK